MAYPLASRSGWDGRATPFSEQAKPYVLLAWGGAGDFGPGPAGTKTDGWQEALAAWVRDAWVRDARDLYVKGGFGGRKAVYHIRQPIRFPGAQDFRVDGGVYVLNWEGSAEDDLPVMDSAMNREAWGTGWRAKA